MKKKMFLSISVVLIALLFCGAVIAVETENSAETVLVRIENEVITQEEIDALMANIDPQMAFMYMTPEGNAMLIEELINARLFAIKGMEEGFEKGIEQGIETAAKNAIAKGLAFDVIQDITGLDIETIMKCV